MGTLFVIKLLPGRTTCAQSDYIRRNGYFVSEDFGTMNGQWVYLRVHTLKKGEHKT